MSTEAEYTGPYYCAQCGEHNPHGQEICRACGSVLSVNGWLREEDAGIFDAIIKQNALVAAKDAEIAALREALAPFGKLAIDQLIPDGADDSYMLEVVCADSRGALCLTVGDVRRAVAALGTTQKEQ